MLLYELWELFIFSICFDFNCNFYYSFCISVFCSCHCYSRSLFSSFSLDSSSISFSFSELAWWSFSSHKWSLSNMLFFSIKFSEIMPLYFYFSAVTIDSSSSYLSRWCCFHLFSSIAAREFSSSRLLSSSFILMSCSCLFFIAWICSRDRLASGKVRSSDYWRLLSLLFCFAYWIGWPMLVMLSLLI